MKHSPPLVDLHCHLLPGLDDGAATWDDALAMARMAAGDGVSTVVATPHQAGGAGRISGRMIRDRVEQLQELIGRHDVPLQVLPGAEIRVEPELVDDLRCGELLTLADRGRHVLLEMPHDVYLPVDRLLSGLGALGVVGILAHPERNSGIIAQRDALFPLVEAGCLLQVTAGSLVGRFGARVQKFARWLVGQGLVHFVGSDAHGPGSRRPLLRYAFDCLVALAGYETAVDLCCRNPGLVAAGEDAIRPSENRTKSKPGGWFRWKRAG